MCDLVNSLVVYAEANRCSGDKKYQLVTNYIQGASPTRIIFTLLPMLLPLESNAELNPHYKITINLIAMAEINVS
jgi:hypothetical protein